MKYPKGFLANVFLVWCAVMVLALELMALIELIHSCHDAGGVWIYTDCVKKEAVIW